MQKRLRRFRRRKRSARANSKSSRKVHFKKQFDDRRQSELHKRISLRIVVHRACSFDDVLHARARRQSSAVQRKKFGKKRRKLHATAAGRADFEVGRTGQKSEVGIAAHSSFGRKRN